MTFNKNNGYIFMDSLVESRTRENNVMINIK